MQRLRHKWHKSHRDTGQLVGFSDKTFYNMFSCVFIHPKYSSTFYFISSYNNYMCKTYYMYREQNCTDFQF